jgi:hypothetical protein
MERGEAAPATLSGPMILIKIRAENAPVFLFVLNLSGKLISFTV